MTRHVTFITHPDVLIDPAVPVPDWPLSERGRTRMRAVVGQPWAAGLRSLFCSTERKARTAPPSWPTLWAWRSRSWRNSAKATVRQPVICRSSSSRRWPMPFFARPEESVRGWERAAAAQRRIVAAVDEVLRRAPAEGEIAIVSHGGVGALLLGHLQGRPISREADQPAGRGGHHYAFAAEGRRLLHGWRSIDRS